MLSISAIPKKNNTKQFIGHIYQITYLHTCAHAYKMRYMTFQRGGTQYWGGGLEWNGELIWFSNTGVTKLTLKTICILTTKDAVHSELVGRLMFSWLCIRTSCEWMRVSVMYAISWVFACQHLRQLLGAYLLKSSTKCDHAQGFSTQTNVLIGWIQRFLLATTVQNCPNVQCP